MATGLLLALALGSLVTASASAAGARERRPNLAGLELAGRGLLLTANYERFVSPQVGLGVGVTALPVAVLYLSYVPRETRSPYFSVGGLVIAGAGNGSFLWPSTTTVILQGTAGFQFESATGWFVRPIVTYNQSTVADLEFLVWPGVTIGRAF